MKVNITSVHFKADSKLENFIERKVGKLSGLIEGVMGSEVTLKLENSENRDNKIAEIRLLIKGYDLYAVEHNYDADTIDEAIAAKQAAGEYAYQKGAVNSHLSEQQASEFIYRNRSANSQTLRLHEHNNSL